MLLRADAGSKNGGDLIQAKKYKEIIVKQVLGANVYFNFEISNLEMFEIDWQIIICFNIVRLQEYSYWLKKLKYHKVFLVPIVFPQFEFSAINSVKSFIKILFNGQYADVFKLSLLPKRFLKVFDGFVFLSEREQRFFLGKYLNCLRSDSVSIICPNGVDFIADQSSVLPTLKDRDIDFIVVGRIEKLKNSIDTLIFRNTYFKDKSIVFVGAKNPYHKNYTSLFDKLIAESDAEYLGSIERQSVADLFARSKVLLNLSLLEVSPLVDLEALSQGCKVVTTSFSFTHLVKCDDILIVNPNEAWMLASQIRSMVESEFGNGFNQVHSWEENIIPLINIIKNV